MGSDSLSVGSADGNDVVLRDPTVSRFHAELQRCPGGVRVVDNDSTNGTFAGAIRIERALVSAGTELRFGRTRVRIADGERVDIALLGKDHLGGLRGRSASMRRLMASIEKAAASTASVLVAGESGTGKEVVARTLHELSPRAKGPLVTVDCGALSPTLVASELFGHEKGAFTGADRRYAGAFERASGGTLFLDEVGELPPDLQSNLLGVLERRRLRRLGGQDEIPVDIRIVSATHRDLRKEVNREAFRLDLYYRLAVVVMQVPPLREHIEDLPVLIDHFLDECGQTARAEEVVPETTMKALESYDWPGNVRELRNYVEALVAMGEPPRLEAVGEAAASKADPIGALLGQPYGTARGALLNEFESRYFAALLERAGGNVSAAARDARMNRSHLIDMLKRHGIGAKKGS